MRSSKTESVDDPNDNAATNRKSLMVVISLFEENEYDLCTVHLHTYMGNFYSDSISLISYSFWRKKIVMSCAT